MKPAIVVQNLAKRYSRYDVHRPLTWQQALLSGMRRMRAIHQFWVLQDLNFMVFPGQMLGVIGQNGAGKSTLLQLLGGVIHPDRGRIQVNGRLGALLDLGAGFHGDLSGRENVFMTAIAAGLTQREVSQAFDAIVEFAELSAFIEHPLRTYSTGMQMRLAFAIAIHTQPQVLLVDEFLAVGDLAFQAKCLNRILELKQAGCAIVLISHDVRQVEQLCDQVLWLKSGQVAGYGEPAIVTGQYLAELRSTTLARTPLPTPQQPAQVTSYGTELQLNHNRFGSQEAEITDVRLLPSHGITSGEPLQIEIAYRIPPEIRQPIFSVAISDAAGQICVDLNTTQMSVPLPEIINESRLTLQFDRLDLSQGQYFVDVGLYERNWSYAYDFHWHVYPLNIHSSIHQGILCPPHNWQVSVPASIH